MLDYYNKKKFIALLYKLGVIQRIFFRMFTLDSLEEFMMGFNLKFSNYTRS